MGSTRFAGRKCMLQENCCHNEQEMGRKGKRKAQRIAMPMEIEEAQGEESSKEVAAVKTAVRLRKEEQRVSIIVRRAKRSVSSGRSAQCGETLDPAWNSAPSVIRAVVLLVKSEPIA